LYSNISSDLPPLNQSRYNGKNLEFGPQTKEDLLALDTAQALNDLKSLPLYLKYAKIVPESIIRQTLSWIKQIPDLRIKRSRAALFNCVIKKYVKRAH